MKRLTCALAVGACLSTGQVPAFAEELWTPHLSGIQSGYPTGHLPPSGVYLINTTDVIGATVYGPDGKATGTKATGLVEVPEIGWVTPWKVLGADYAMLVAQPWTLVNLRPPLGALGGELPAIYGATPSVSRSGAYATFVTPAYLSWQLPEHFSVAARADVFIPDGGWKNPLTGHGIAGHLNALDFYSFQPSLAVSYLNDGWNFSAKMLADINAKNQGNDYKSGNSIATELSATKTFGKWTLGVVGYTKDQIEDDSGNAYKTSVAVGLAAPNGNRDHDYAIGPYVSYNFGPVILSAWLDHSVSTTNTIGGDQLFTRIMIPIM